MVSWINTISLHDLFLHWAYLENLFSELWQKKKAIMTDVAKVYRSSVGKPKMITFYHPKTSKTRPKSHHPHLTCHSPLRVRDSIPNLLPLPPIAVQQHREREYVNDAIKTDVVRIKN